MKKILTFAIGLLAVSPVCAQTAILMVHYGTGNDTARARTLDVINAKVRDHTGCEVREAYSSGMVVEALKKRGIVKQTVSEALESLHRDGYKKVVVQTTNLLDGVMTHAMQAEVAARKADFDTMVVGRPLLWDIDDCRSLVDLVTYLVPAHEGTEVFCVGHGTQGPANAIYAQLDYLFADEGHSRYHVVTLEGYPNRSHLERTARLNGALRVVLVPLLYIAGNHKRDDLNDEWKKLLQQQGYEVEVIQTGLGEVPEVQQFVLRRIDDLLQQVQ